MPRIRSLAWFLATAAGLPLVASVANVAPGGALSEARAADAGAAAPGRSAAAVVGALPAGVAARERGDGWTFADERGMTLYTYDRDEGSPGESTCVEACSR
jgi:predicted lipoprotein with Yx(FWY)xxD motif